jgi:hypothetical protein
MVTDVILLDPVASDESSFASKYSFSASSKFRRVSMGMGPEAPYMYNSKKATTFLREWVGDAVGAADGAAVGVRVYFLEKVGGVEAWN